MGVGALGRELQGQISNILRGLFCRSTDPGTQGGIDYRRQGIQTGGIRSSGPVGVAVDLNFGR